VCVCVCVCVCKSDSTMCTPAAIKNSLVFRVEQGYVCPPPAHTHKHAHKTCAHAYLHAREPFFFWQALFWGATHLLACAYMRMCPYVPSCAYMGICFPVPSSLSLSLSLASPPSRRLMGRQSTWSCHMMPKERAREEERERHTHTNMPARGTPGENKHACRK
jgi:hypothetical protein